MRWIVSALCLSFLWLGAGSGPAQAATKLFGADAAGVLFAIDVADGSGVVVGVLSSGSVEIEFDEVAMRSFSQAPGGSFDGAEFDIANGRQVGATVAMGGRFAGLETVGGVWYGTVVFSGSSNVPSELRTLDPFTGSSTLIGLTGVDEIQGLAYDGATMYAIEGGNSDSDLYTVNLGTGAVTVVGNTGIRAGSLEFGPDDRLYAGGVGPNAGDLYVIDTATGASTLIGATGFGALRGLALVDDSVFECPTTVLGADGQGGLAGNLYAFDPLSGALMATVGAVGYPVTGLADHPVTCALWGVTSPTFDALDNPNPGHLITLDKTTGAGTLVGDVLAATDAGPTDITFASDGTLYGWTSDTHDLITIDLGSGAGTVVGDSGLTSSGVGLAASPSDQLHLAGDGGAPGSTLTLVNALAGIPTGNTPLFGDVVTGSSILAMDFGCSGLLIAVHSLGAGVTNLVTINAGTGALSTLGSTQSGLDAITGFCQPSPPTAFYTLDPCRVLDTRNADGPLGGPALVAGADRAFVIAGTCGVPVTATAVSINIAVTGSTSPGNLRLHPGGTPVPLVSSINYVAGQTRSNNAIVPLNVSGELSVYVGQVSGEVHFILDVNGYFE